MRERSAEEVVVGGGEEGEVGEDAEGWGEECYLGSEEEEEVIAKAAEAAEAIAIAKAAEEGNKAEEWRQVRYPEGLVSYPGLSFPITWLSIPRGVSGKPYFFNNNTCVVYVSDALLCQTLPNMMQLSQFSSWFKLEDSGEEFASGSIEGNCFNLVPYTENPSAFKQVQRNLGELFGEESCCNFGLLFPIIEVQSNDTNAVLNIRGNKCEGEGTARHILREDWEFTFAGQAESLGQGCDGAAPGPAEEEEGEGPAESEEVAVVSSVVSAGAGEEVISESGDGGGGDAPPGSVEGDGKPSDEEGTTSDTEGAEGSTVVKNRTITVSDVHPHSKLNGIIGGLEGSMSIKDEICYRLFGMPFDDVIANGLSITEAMEEQREESKKSQSLPPIIDEAASDISRLVTTERYDISGSSEVNVTNHLAEKLMMSDQYPDLAGIMTEGSSSAVM